MEKFVFRQITLQNQQEEYKVNKKHKHLSCELTKTVQTQAENGAFMWDPIIGKKLIEKVSLQVSHRSSGTKSVAGHCD